MNNLLISGFPGIGKTYFKNNSVLNVADSDSSKFSWIKEGVRNPNFPKVYIEHIKDMLRSKDIVLVSSHKEVRDALVQERIRFWLVYPKRELKTEYLLRFEKRGSPQKFLDFLDSNWDNFITEMENQKFCEHKRLISGKYIGSVIM